MIRIFLVAGLLIVGGAVANGQQAEQAKEAPREQYPFFTDAESRLILDFYRPGSGHLPPGLQKRMTPAPAASAKLLARGGTLPVALEKSVEPFPQDLERRLTTSPPGYRRVLHGILALLIQDSTRLIVDALDLTRR
ncbi:MAG TPA: hypothetical protein VGK29_15315 [Paludibaculum sp.]|jgi:hypothetical protein